MGQAVEPATPWLCQGCLTASRRILCKRCVLARLHDARADLGDVLARADVWRDKLGAVVLERHGKMNRDDVLQRSFEARRRVSSLQERCRLASEANAQDLATVERLSGRVESAAHLEAAEGELRQKESQICREREPLLVALRAELDTAQGALLSARRVLVRQAVEIFQVVDDGVSGVIMSMPLPKYLHSLNREGAQQECTAVTLLARLTSMIASLLGIRLPFPLEFRPSHCLIQGKLLTPLSSSAMSEEGWMEHYRLSLHMLALDTRHIMLSQLGDGAGGGGEREGYSKICATNDISPLRSLKNLLWLAAWPSLGRDGEDVEVDYAHAEHAAFAEAHSSATIDQDWALLLPPRPSESDD